MSGSKGAMFIFESALSPASFFFMQTVMLEMILLQLLKKFRRFLFLHRPAMTVEPIVLKYTPKRTKIFFVFAND
jgi:hypothetical protein